MSQIIHPFTPVYNSESTVLILGSFPSVKSRENKFYYGHPQNRFWKILAVLFNESVPITVEDKIEFLLKNKIALWDVIESCEINGSSDSSIRNVKTTEINLLINNSNIKNIFVNGKAAEKYYYKYQYPITNVEAKYLPSSSPANAKMSLEDLIKIWSKIKSTE